VAAPILLQQRALAYGGQDYPLRSWWDPGSLSGADWGKWLLRRRASTPFHEERVILWVRQEG